MNVASLWKETLSILNCILLRLSVNFHINLNLLQYKNHGVSYNDNFFSYNFLSRKDFLIGVIIS